MGVTSCERSLTRSSRGALATALVLALALSGCGRGVLSEPAPPALDGHRVMLLPVRIGDPPALDAELAFWLPDRSPAVDWVLPAELQRAVDRAPGWRVRLDALPREIVDARRRSPYLVDPTYSEVRRLGAVTDATLALMPVAVRDAADGAPGELELTVALVDIRGGQVLWIRSVRGRSADGSAHGAAAAVAEALARTLFPDRRGG
jgi:hypothetical protein